MVASFTLLVISSCAFSCADSAANKHLQPQMVKQLLLVTAIFAVVKVTDADRYTLNENGGNEAENTDGLMLEYGWGSFQAYRVGRAWIYPGNTPEDFADEDPDGYMVLGVGSKTFYGIGVNSMYTTSANGVTVDVQEEEEGDYVVADESMATTMTQTVDGLDYQVHVAWQYAFPNDYLTFDLGVTIPAGNTETVRLWVWVDPTLQDGESIDGPGFAVNNYVVGVTTPDDTIYEEMSMGFIHVGGQPWSGHQSEAYSCNSAQPEAAGGGSGDGCVNPANEGHGPYYATDYANAIHATQDNDGAFGFSLNFGKAAGTYMSSNIMFLIPKERLAALVEQYKPGQEMRPYATIVSLWVGK
jgi:hypothetical protein